MIYLFISAIVFLLLFTIILKQNRYSLFVGLFFNLFIASVLIFLAVYVSQNNVPILFYLIYFILILIALVFVFGIYFVTAFLFINAMKVFKKETKSLANSLGLLLGVVLVLYVFLSWYISIATVSIVLVIWQLLSLLLLVFFTHFYLFISSVIIVNVFNNKRKVDYLIVLGSGLIEGKVPPLLASRINKAIEYKSKLKLVNAKIVFSGGQGIDEPIAEAQAMKEYAINKGVKANDILIEDKSTNTFENFNYSMKIINNDSSKRDFKIAFFSNNYHIFRAGIYAKLAKIPAIGIGSKTAFYYLPNAIIREYIAILVLHKKLYIVLTIIILILFIIYQVFTYLVLPNV